MEISIRSKNKQNKKVPANRASEGEESQTSRCSTNNNLVIKIPNHNSDKQFKPFHILPSNEVSRPSCGTQFPYNIFNNLLYKITPNNFQL